MNPRTGLDGALLEPRVLRRVPGEQDRWLGASATSTVLTKNDAPFNEVFGSYTNRGFTVKIEKSEKPANVWVEPKEFEPFPPDASGRDAD